MKKAADIMSTEIITVSPTTSVSELAQILTNHKINGVPVVDEGGNLQGVVTENDLIYQKKNVHIPTVLTILDSVIYLESPENLKKEMHKITGSTVADIYTQPVVTIDKNTPIEEIATIMAEKNIHTIPVLEDGKIVGVVGTRDILMTLIS